MSRSRHPNKHIELAIQYAESLGWRVELSRGHGWGHLLCPRSTREGCIVSVWSTPKNPRESRPPHQAGCRHVSPWPDRPKPARTSERGRE